MHQFYAPHLRVTVSVNSPFGRVAKWQTRWLQVPVFASTWGFKSPLAHKIVIGFDNIRRDRNFDPNELLSTQLLLVQRGRVLMLSQSEKVLRVVSK